jgi:O-acetyl-ADP-ribose deacetylase (regulator of RNase III)
MEVPGYGRLRPAHRGEVRIHETMIREVRGNLLAADADALVNAVNTVGVAGKGIALQFRQEYPENFRAYRDAAKRGEIRPGRMFTWETGQPGRPYLIISFPTKRHWRDASRIEDIQAGLHDLVRCIGEHGVASVAIPALGCGNGGLDWTDVRKIIMDVLELAETEVFLYVPY